jgi:putative PIN family toxin of toxin-antitoxin system
LRVVVDASVIVGAALKDDSTPMRALLAVVEHDSLVLSTAVFAEISEVLGRPKFAAAVTPGRRQEILGLLTTAATWIEPSLTVTDCLDPDDNKYLELAEASRAAVIVSSDRHLLQMHPWNGIAILRPAEYLVSPSAAPPF